MVDSIGGVAVETEKKGSRLWPFLAGLLLCIIPVALYIKSHDFELVYDDVHIITYNSSINSLKDHPGGFLSLYTQEFWKGAHEGETTHDYLAPKGQALYRPVMLTILGTVYYFFESNGTPYHILNIITYALVCLMVFITLRKLFGSVRLAFFAGLLFACHPIHTEAACYAVGIAEMAGTLFLLLALLFYFKAGYEEDRFKLWPYLLSLLFYLIGLFTKEHVIAFLGIIFLYDLIQVLSGRRPLGLLARAGMYVGYLLVIGANLAARFNAIGSVTPSEQHPLDNVIAAAAGFGTRLWTALHVLAKGIWLNIMPIHLSPDYSYAAIKLQNNPLKAEVLLSIFFLCILLYIGISSLRKRPVLAFGILWYFITIFLVSNIPIVIGTIFGERLLFLPSLGFCLVVAFLLDRLFAIGSREGRRYGTGAFAASILLIALSCVYSMKTHQEIDKWENDDLLFEAAKEVCPNSARVQFQLGQIYGNNKILQESEKHLRRAVMIDPSFMFARLSLAEILFQQGKLDQALQEFEQIKMGASYKESEDFKNMVHGRLAQLNLMLQRTDGAIEELLALKEEKDTPAINLQIGDLYAREGDYEKAAEYYEAAWNLAPEQYDAAYRLLATYTERGMSEEENILLNRLIEGDTTSNKAFLYKASVCERAFETDKALEAYDKAIQRSSEDPIGYFMKASLLKTQFRYEEAMAALEQAIAFSPTQSKVGPLLMKLEICKETNDLAKGEETAAQLRELPQSKEVKASLGDLYLKMGRHKEASQMLKESIAGGLKTVANYVNLGTALSHLQKDEDIVAYLTPAVEEQNHVDPTLYATLGISLINIEEYKKGSDLLREVLLTWGPNPYVKLWLSKGHLELGDYKGTAGMLEDLEKNSSAQQLLPLVYHLQARVFLEDPSAPDPGKAVERARKAIEQLRAVSPPDVFRFEPAMQLTLAKALVAEGKKDEAVQALEGALADYPDDEDLKAYRESLQ